MAREIHSKEMEERQTVVGQERPAVEEPPGPVPGAGEPGQEVTPVGIPLAIAPTPPGGRLSVSIQRMPPAWRWTLGLGLALLSSFAFVLLPDNAIAFGVMFVLALAAGFVLSSWWELPALAMASAAGGLVGNWVFVQISPAGAIEGLSGWDAVVVGFGFFVLVSLGPLILLLLAGVGFGKLQGTTLGSPQVLSAGQARVSRWIAALGPVISAGFLATPVGYIPGMHFGVATTISFILYAVVLAATCLLSGWLLRSWWGLVVAPAVYAGAAGLRLVIESIGVPGSPALPDGFVLYIVLPAVVMSAIGTAIRMSRAHRR